MRTVPQNRRRKAHVRRRALIAAAMHIHSRRNALWQYTGKITGSSAKNNMISTVNFSNFCDAFLRMGRKEQFTYEGKRALFDYLEQYEEDAGEKIELDVIALCCDYTEYESIDEALKEYDSIKNLDGLRDNTTVIEVGDTGRLIIQAF